MHYRFSTLKNQIHNTPKIGTIWSKFNKIYLLTNRNFYKNNILINIKN